MLLYVLALPTQGGMGNVTNRKRFELILPKGALARATYILPEDIPEQFKNHLALLTGRGDTDSKSALTWSDKNATLMKISFGSITLDQHDENGENVYRFNEKPPGSTLQAGISILQEYLHFLQHPIK